MFGRKLLCIFPIASLFFGCGKSPVSAPASATSSVAPATIPAKTPAPEKTRPTESTLRIHWLGKKKIVADPNSENLRQIWNLPETLKLEAQTLDKLSAAPWRIFLGQTNQAQTNLLLRPLLDDVLSNECYLEIRKSADSPTAPDEIVFAIQLDKDRAALWQTNLATALKSLTGTAPESRSARQWVLKRDSRNIIEFASQDGWTIVSAAPDHNQLLDETLGRIQREHTPVAASSNAWFEGSIDLARMAHGTNSARVLPKVSFSFNGDRTNVITTGEFAFPDNEPLKFESWDMPTNMVTADLTSFMAVRGLKPWLESSKFWTRFQAGSPPDQLYVWAERGFPMRTYFATPMTDASNAVARVSDRAMQKEGPRLLEHALAGFQRSQTFNGLSWQGFPYFAPFLQSFQTNDVNYAIGGFMQLNLPLTSPSASELAGYLRAHTNLVYYDREITGIRIEQWIVLSQAVRFVSGAAQLPGQSASFTWLMAMTARLGNCDTEMTQTAPTKLSFSRRSNVGFSAFELDLLADWLESPVFPRGIYSLEMAPPEP